jgi:hypothetical protein
MVARDAACIVSFTPGTAAETSELAESVSGGTGRVRFGRSYILMIDPNRLERKVVFVPSPSKVSSLMEESPSALTVIVEE